MFLATPLPDPSPGVHRHVIVAKMPYTVKNVRLKGYSGLWTCTVTKKETYCVQPIKVPLTAPDDSIK